MTILDYGLIGIVVFSTAIGLMRGLVSEVIALAAWVLAFIAARQFGGDVGLRPLARIALDRARRTSARIPQEERPRVG